jgi:hypothetical protein
MSCVLASDQINPSKIENKKNIFEQIDSFISESQKDLIKTIRTIFEFLEICLKYTSAPVRNMIDLTKAGTSSMAFIDISKSAFRSINTLTTFSRNSIIKLTQNILDLSWNTFKVFKSLNTYKIVNFTSGFYLRFMTFGGLALATEKSISILQGIRSFDAESKPQEDRDAYILAKLYILSRNVGLVAIGIITALKGLIGFSSPFLMLLFGSIVLISTFAITLIKLTNPIIKDWLK